MTIILEDALTLAFINAVGYFFGTLIAQIIHDNLLKKSYRRIKKIWKKR